MGWSLKYKRSINCKRPKGFSQKQYCDRQARGGRRLSALGAMKSRKKCGYKVIVSVPKKSLKRAKQIAGKQMSLDFLRTYCGDARCSVFFMDPQDKPIPSNRAYKLLRSLKKIKGTSGKAHPLYCNR